MTTRDHVSKAEFVGRLGADPELRFVEADATPYVRLSLATSETFTGRDGEIRDKTEWHNAVAWGPKAEEIAQNFAKGDAVVLTGTMRVNSYETDGVKHRVTELHVESAEKNLDNVPSKNSTRLIGTVREQPTVKELESGVVMTTLSLATRIKVQERSGEHEREDWHRITLWGKTAEAARSINAGDTVSINGSLRHRIVPDKEGRDHRVSAVDCQRFQVLDRAHGRSAEAQKGPSEGRQQHNEGTAAPDMTPPAAPRARSKKKALSQGL